MVGQGNKIKQVLLRSDTIIRSKTDPDVELFYKYYEVTPVTEKYLCIVVKAVNEPFIITSYFTDTIKRGGILWEKQ